MEADVKRGDVCIQPECFRTGKSRFCKPPEIKALIRKE